MTIMYAGTGTLFKAVKFGENDGKPPRYGVEAFDNMMMERDKRLTGSLRGQNSDPVAPQEFATNGAWPTRATS